MSIAGAAIAGGTALAGGLASFFGQSSANKANIAAQKLANQGNMELAAYQYDRQLDMWNQYNAYNTPASQMKRYKDAGLNPNLIYGQGSSGNASSYPQYEAPTLGAYTGQKSALGVGVANALNSLSSSASVQNLLQQNENLKTQSDAVRAQTITEGLKQANLVASTSRSEYDLKLAKQLERYNLDAAKLNVSKLSADIANVKANTKFTISNTELNSLRVKYTDAQIHNLEVATQKLMQDYDLQSYDLELRRLGINSNDALIERLVGRALNQVGDAVESTEAPDFIKNLLNVLRNK